MVSQAIAYPAPVRNNVVQAWIEFQGVSDSSENVYAIANGTYGSSVDAPATIATSKRCGPAPASYSPTGYNTVSSALSSSNCSLAVTQEYVQDATTFTQTATVQMLPEATTGSLVLGSELSVLAGWNIYVNPGGTSATVDTYAGSSATFKLEGALALTLSGAAAAVAALAF